VIEDSFVDSRVVSLLRRYQKLRGHVEPPVEPAQFTDLCSVLSVEYRRMIPEGVLSPVEGGFRIFLQNNFIDHPGMKVRQRFTLAHELAHTFFYDLSASVPKPMKGLPRRGRLEHLCHVAANQLLLPEFLLKKELTKTGEVSSAQSILNLAERFGVSVEVLMRRLHKLGFIADDKFAAVLVDTNEGRRLIQAACYGSLLRCSAVRPTRGMDFDAWVRPLLSPSGSPLDSAWAHTTSTATITARKVYRSNRSFILDLRFEPPPLKLAF
jgi:IrrE N-terminal-like domain